MGFWFYFLVIFGILIILLLIFGLPRKKSERVSSIEGIDDPDVAKAFERMTNFFPFKLLRRKIIKELKKFDPHGMLVDIGCGSGNLLVQIAEQFPTLNLTGIDISAEILERAKNRASEKGVDNRIQFKIGDADQLPFPNNSIDFIVSTLSLHHWETPIQVFEEMMRVLKPDGTFLVFDFRRDARKFFYGLFTFATKVVVPKPLKKIHEPLGSIRASYTPNDIIQMLSQTAFQNVAIIPYLAWMFITNKKF